MSERTFIAGLDLGQQQDPSTLAIAEVTGVPKRYAVRHLHRWPLATSYPTIISDIARWYAKPPLAASTLVVDATGVGRPVVDGLRAQHLHAHIIPAVITSGYQTTRGKGYLGVPKADLVGALRMVLGQGRLRISARLPLAKTAQRELENFTLKVSEKGLETYGNADSTTHDDLVIALALLAWYGDRYQPSWGMRTYQFSTRKPPPGRHIMVCGKDQLPELHRDPDLPTLAITIRDNPTDEPTLPHGKLLAWHPLCFQDIEPDDISGPWNPELQDGLLSPEQARQLWAWLSQPQFAPVGQSWQCLIVVDNGGQDRRALSLALAIADSLRLPRSNVILHGENDSLDDDEEPPSPWMYQTIKRGRLAIRC